MRASCARVAPSRRTRRWSPRCAPASLRRPLPELPCKYFYDERGSALFEAITRARRSTTRRAPRRRSSSRARGARSWTRCAPVELAELGSGAGRKIRFFLDAMRARGRLESVRAARDQRGVPARVGRPAAGGLPRGRACAAIVGDFVHDLAALGPGGDRLLLFLAGTIGNLHPDELPAVLPQPRRQCSLPATASWSASTSSRTRRASTRPTTTPPASPPSSTATSCAS